LNDGEILIRYPEIRKCNILKKEMLSLRAENIEQQKCFKEMRRLRYIPNTKVMILFVITFLLKATFFIFYKIK